MRPHGLQPIAAACLQTGVLVAATTLAADAQTWRWTYVTRTPNSPLLTAQSSVAISGNRVQMSYTVPLQNRQIVIESCRADVHDISEATTIRTSGTSYLLVRFKPAHSAACASGQRPAVALPTDDTTYINRVAAAINRTCCTSAAVAALPSAKPSPAPAATATPAHPVSPAPSPAASPSPSASPVVSASPAPVHAAVRAWVENDGLFWFVRLRNAGPGAVPASGEIVDCRNVDIGCGSFARTLIAPGATATVATIASTNRGTVPSFTYHYSAGDGAQTVSGSGSSRTRSPRGATHMSAQELRAAQAFALNEFASPRATQAPIQPARLVKRGSSRLAIGQTGTAVVRLEIASDGTPQEAAIVSITNKQLTAAAIETAVSSTYAPATQNGRSVAAKYVATFSFDGQDPALSTIPLWKRSPAPAPSPSLPPPATVQATARPSAPAAQAPAAQTPAVQSSAPPAPAAITPGGGANSPPPTPPPPAAPSAAPSTDAGAVPAPAPASAAPTQH